MPGSRLFACHRSGPVVASAPGVREGEEIKASTDTAAMTTWTTPSRRARIAEHTILLAGAAIFLTAAISLLVTGHTTIPTSADYRPGPLWTLWLPVAAALLLIRVLPWRVPDTDMTRRVRERLKGRSFRREIALLLGCMVGFYVGDLVLYPVFCLVDASLCALSYYTSKVFFLFITPLVFIGSYGIMRHASGPDLGGLAVRAGEPWRWAGMGAVVAYLAMVFAPWASHPPDLGRVPESYALLVVLALSVVGTSLLEEVFFRAMLQTRLEMRFGRWPGIVLAALCYGVTGIVATSYPDDLWIALGTAISVQGVAGLMYGYLWSRYRNIWLNFLLHTCATTLALIPLTHTLAGRP
ncbi:hypothetical protein GCM10009799_06700 [Nocardiopsis rhodophaea]|uniref:CAAX prenyl protease 2/Lysostaphin resistance protein A-like domain-containing protein n=1 Tax=Nocardiopsis rhodophaea TaxID=280238 RepID=A0ABN2SBT7_9ACTN